jgi:hypothetical protein
VRPQVSEQRCRSQVSLTRDKGMLLHRPVHVAGALAVAPYPADPGAVLPAPFCRQIGPNSAAGTTHRCRYSRQLCLLSQVLASEAQRGRCCRS